LISFGLNYRPNRQLVIFLILVCWNCWPLASATEVASTERTESMESRVAPSGLDSVDIAFTKSTLPAFGDLGKEFYFGLRIYSSTDGRTLVYRGIRYTGENITTASDVNLNTSFANELLNQITGGTLRIGQFIPTIEVKATAARMLYLPAIGSIQIFSITKEGKNKDKDGFRVIIPWSLHEVKQKQIGVAPGAQAKLTEELLDQFKNKPDQAVAHIGGLKVTTGKIVSGSIEILMVPGEYRITADAGEGQGNITSNWIEGKENDRRNPFLGIRLGEFDGLKGGDVRNTWFPTNEPPLPRQP
jgi:hypothetical protein